MIADFFARIVEGYTDPRRSVARLLSPGYGIEIAFQIIILSYIISAVLGFVVTGERATDGPFLIGYAIGLGFQAILFALLAMLLHVAAKSFGGTGSLVDVFLALSWHFLVTSFLTPVILVAFSAIGGDGGVPAGAGALLLIVTAVSLWLLAAYLAEAHNFTRTGSVFGVVVAVPLLIGLLATMVLPTGG